MLFSLPAAFAVVLLLLHYLLSSVRGVLSPSPCVHVHVCVVRLCGPKGQSSLTSPTRNTSAELGAARALPPLPPPSPRVYMCVVHSCGCTCGYLCRSVCLGRGPARTHSSLPRSLTHFLTPLQPPPKRRVVVEKAAAEGEEGAAAAAGGDGEGTPGACSEAATTRVGCLGAWVLAAMHRFYALLLPGRRGH